MAMKEGFLESFGYKVHYVRWEGKGQKLLLIHSMGLDAHSMDKLAESLQDKYNILSLTILGHGDSGSPTAHLLLNEHAEIMRSCYRQLDFYPSVLIGHSVGGMMGMILTAEYPKEFKGLVLVDIAPFDSINRRTRPAPPQYFDNENKAREWLKERYPGFTQYYYDNRIKYAFTGKDGKLWLKPTGDSVRSGLSIDLWGYVEKIKCPVLMLKGVESETISSTARMRMEKTVPNIEVVEVKGTGHMIPQDVPEKFEELITGFLAKIK